MSAHQPRPEPPHRPTPRRRDRIPQGLWIRVLLHGIAGHLVAAFLIFLFSLGADNP
ncbi:DUF6126 family protein [Streptomyces radicis]|uniref:DUF6126 family protein n=1 Tax=Streptomyces radicis TaxID=1750517 RepID=UPI0015FEF0C0|nr:DUF6126 family protein [Streptomyces radicis]